MRRVWALVWKDLLVEFRGREFLGAMVVFALITIVTLNFAFDLSRGSREAPGAGGLWIAFLFAGMLGLGRSLAVERDRGTLEGLTLCPVDAGTIFLGKFISNVTVHRYRPGRLAAGLLRTLQPALAATDGAV